MTDSTSTMTDSTNSPFEAHLDRQLANHEALSPAYFLEHIAAIYPNRTAVIHGDSHYSYAEFHGRCVALASALAARGIGKNDTVSIIAPNIPAHLEAHYGVPLAGAVLNSINIRLDASTVAYIIDHGECDILLVDTQFADLAAQALAQAQREPLVVDIHDLLGPEHKGIGSLDYDSLLAEGDPGADLPRVTDEWQSLALNYTSGTTGRPKGVVYHHRGAYLNAVGNGLAWGMPPAPTYLWTLPMFHCNGWCITWTITLYGGTHVCLREVAAAPIYDAMARYGVTHMCGAPIVLSMLASAPDELKAKMPDNLQIMTAGAAPPAAIIEKIENMGATICHTYGLTEVYGPCVYCAWHEEWNGKPAEERAALKSRQGVPYPVLGHLDVLDPESMAPVPADGKTIGEIMFRGNVVMKGYLKNPEATQKDFAGGWFHSGDLAVKHPDGYVEVKDRSKDIIISGGENISSIEVEDALYKHPDVMNAAVVARPDEKWGETPCAFIELNAGAQQPSDEELQEFCRQHLAGFMLPKHFVFGELPKTSTGKIQKFKLREAARNL